MAFAWAFLWQIAVSLTSLFVLYFCVRHLPRKLREGTKEERLMILFALFFAMAIAASTLIFHVRYRAPAEFLLVVLALQTIRFSAAPVLPLAWQTPRASGLPVFFSFLPYFSEVDHACIDVALLVACGIRHDRRSHRDRRHRVRALAPGGLGYRAI